MPVTAQHAASGSARFSLAANYDPELIPELAPYPVDEVYGKFPDDGISGGCTACHSATPPATHMNGTFTADAGNNTVAERFVSRTGMTYTEMTPTSGRSGTCSGTA